MVSSPYWYTYLLIDARTGHPFYVGKGCKERMYQHQTGSRHNRYLRERVEELKALGIKIVYEKWFESDDEWFCYWMENYLINYFGLENLCNLTRGGEGPPSGDDHPSKDPKARAATGKRFKEYQQTHGHPFLGKHHTEEAIQKNREAHIGLNTGEDHWTFGIPYPEEARANMIASAPRGEDHRLFGVKGESHPAHGYKHTPEELEAIREASKRSIANNPGFGFQKGCKSPNQGGETNGRAKLTEAQVWEIHDRYHLANETIISLAGSRDRCGYMSNLLTGNIWTKVHAAWHAKNPGFSMRVGEHRKDPEVTARRVANLVPATAEARTAKSEKTWATRRQKECLVAG